MRTKAIVSIFLVALSCALGQDGTYVTNWVNPPASYRIVTNHLFDVNVSRGWYSVRLPQLRYGFDGGGGPPAPGQRKGIRGTQYNPHGGPPSLTFVVNNWPWNPTDFQMGPNGLTPRVGTTFRLFLLESSTNYDHAGKPNSIYLQYDFGLPATNKIPVVVKSKKDP